MFDEFNAAKGTSVSIDAKQRTIGIHLRNPSNEANYSVACAEPSQDALTTHEGAASIEPQTQTITILPDALYRSHEDYASGALDEIAFARLQRRHQSTMLGPLGIEQLTAAVLAIPAAVGGSVGAELG